MPGRPTATSRRSQITDRSPGDNIYHSPEDALKQTGDEDDGWYLTLYQPYRHLVDHLPLYPAAGNHDGADQEESDDRAQLADNFHLENRFRPWEEEGRASLDPGLFCHHPAYCAGPHHECMQDQIDRVVPPYHRAGVRLVLHGHEHNFQHGRMDGLDYVVSEAAAKLQDGSPCREKGGTVSRAREPHCRPQPIQALTPDGQPVDSAFSLSRAAG